jgi:hypothetical protein
MSDIPWFSRVGTPLDDLDRDTLDALARAQFVDANVEIVQAPNVHAAVAWLESEHGVDGWNDDEEERERLWTQLTEAMTESEVVTQLAAVVSTAAPEVRAAAARALAREAGTAAEPVDAAAAAALLALHQHALARLAGADNDHPFVRKYAVFVRGRWPLGRHAARYGVY